MKEVLLVCTHNAGRSKMAQALFERDTTSHRWRLAKLLPQPITGFGDTRAPEVIRGCAERVLDDYDDVAIRSHILTLPHKQTRECLRQDTCAPL